MLPITALPPKWALLHLPLVKIQFVTWFPRKFALKEDEEVGENTGAIFFPTVLQFRTAGLGPLEKRGSVIWKQAHLCGELHFYDSDFN